MIKIDGKIKRVGTLRYQVHWLSDQLTRWHQWHMLVQSSRVDHVILEGCYISEVMGGHSDWGSDGGLGCDGMRSKGSSLGMVRTNQWDQTGQGGPERGQ